MNGDVKIRELSITDDLGRAGELIFQVDPYICPDFFGDEERARKIGQILFDEKGGLFDCGHTLVAEMDGRLVGILVFADNKIAAWDCEKMRSEVEALGIEMPEQFDRANKEYMKAIVDDAMILPDGVGEVEWLAVDSTVRNSGIGQKLLDAFLSRPEYHEQHLTVLADNPQAIHAYQKKGFQIVSTQTGYPNESVGTHNMVRK